MKVLIVAVAAALVALPAAAQKRANKAFNTVNGRTSTAAPAAPRVHTLTTPGGGAVSNAPVAAQAPSVSHAMINGAPSNGGRAFMGGGRRSSFRSAGATRRAGKAFLGNGPIPTNAEEPAPTPEEAPPHYSKPGALIRTTGQKPVYTAVETGTHTRDAGEIVFNNRKGFDVARAPSIQMGPRDTPPPPNPTGDGTYFSGATANAPAPSGNGNGNGNGIGNGGNNNGSGNNDKNKPGDDFDQHGGDKAMVTSFYDAF